MILRDQITLEEAYAYTDGRNVVQYKFDGATVPAADGGPYPAGPKTTATIPAYVSTVSAGTRTDLGSVVFVEELRALIQSWPTGMAAPSDDAPKRFRVWWDGKLLTIAALPMRRKQDRATHHWTLRLK